jgi:uncharacterized protein (TIGR02996 family)
MSEEAFLQAIMEAPGNAGGVWLILADWLEERGDVRSELVRLRHDSQFRPELSPAERDDRVRQLLAAGVTPCVPAWTNSLGMKFVLIPPGKFLMGSPESEAGRSDEEGPQHEVEITRPFYLGIHPVTQGQYRKVTGKNPSHFNRKNGGGADHPVSQVSWEEAASFCRKLSERAEEKAAGRTYRLPTEAEWEYACRGGANSSSPFFFGDSLSFTEANFNGNYPYGGAAKGPFLERTTPVGTYPPNAFGLYDMHGTIWEWCQDWVAPYGGEAVKDPTGPPTGERRVLRGGSWGSHGIYARSAFRSHAGTAVRDTDCGVGFRVVCVAPPGVRNL